MAAIVDSGAIYALYDAADAQHHRVRAAVEHERGPLLVPVALLAEVDYLIRTYLGIDAELHFLRDIRSGFFQLVPLTDTDLRFMSTLIDRYREIDLGLADASVFATAERLGIRRVLTVDERHFRFVRVPSGSPVIVLPADEV